jgi:lysozyme family protein
MPARFDTCLEFTLDWEGRVLEHDPNDPGGVTFAGIDQRDHPGVDVKHLDLDGARMIYYNERWLKFRCDELGPPWDLLVFDSSVNPGPGFPVKAMQDCLAVKVDGLIGAHTIAATKSNGPVGVNTNAAIKCFLKKRYEYYANLPWRLRKHFLVGWNKRTDALASNVGFTKWEDRTLVA